MPHDNIMTQSIAYSALCTSGPEYIVYVTFAMFSKHSLVVIDRYRKPMRACSRKRIIVYRKYVMFIKQSPTRFTMVTKNDTKTGHFLIYICRHIIQNCFLISYYNNIAVIIIIIINNNNNNNTTIGNQQLQLPVKAWSPPKYALLFDDDRACAQGRSGKTSYQRYHTCVISLIRCFATVEV